MPILIAIFTTGFATNIAQIVILRELLVRFQGNELMVGVVLFFWLLWNGGGCLIVAKLASEFYFNLFLPGFLLAIAGLMLPLSVITVRGAGLIWHLPTGEVPPFGSMILISCLITALFSPLSGALFGAFWETYQRNPLKGNLRRPIFIFIFEGIGAAFGGLAFYFFINQLTTMTIVWTSSLFCALISIWLIQPWRSHRRPILSTSISLLIALTSVFGLYFSDDIEKKSRQWQWGSNFLATYDTAYHNLSLTQQDHQLSLFCNGLWLFTFPDFHGQEEGVHPILLQHPEPKTVLLIGGGISGIVKEVLKYPHIEHVDYIEPDPGVIEFVKNYFPLKATIPLSDPRVIITHQDATVFLNKNNTQYDVILMNLGDPVNAEMNRFYTIEFFRRLKRLLSCNGILSFAVSGSEDMLGRAQVGYLKSIYQTLISVFPDVAFFPGGHFRFIMSNKANFLATTPKPLLETIQNLSLSLSYIREDTLEQIMNPVRRKYFLSIFTDNNSSPLRQNSDFSPTCYLESILLWSTQWHKGLLDLVNWISRNSYELIFTLLAALGIVFFAFGIRQGFHPETAVAINVSIAGGVTMILQMLLILSFQIVAGFAYLQLALIISFFMAGIATGAAFNAHPDSFSESMYKFKLIQRLMTMYPLILAAAIVLLHKKTYVLFSTSVTVVLFSLFSFMSGMIGGFIFSTAIKLSEKDVHNDKMTYSKLYALDLVGAASGLMAGSFLLIPFFGIIQAFIWISGVMLLGSIPFLWVKEKAI